MYIVMNANIVSLIVLWVAAPYCKKRASISMSSQQILAYQSLIVLLLNIVRAQRSGELTKVSFNRWFFVCALISFSSSMVYLHLCKTMKPGDFIPIVQPAVITIIKLCDIYASGSVQSSELLGVALIVCGMVILGRSST